MFRLRSRRRSSLILAAVIISPILIAAAAAQSDLEQHLNDRYKNKTFILRGFYSGSRLKYDSSGHAINPSNPQDWTVAGVVQVERISLSHDRLKIDARRLHLGWLGEGFREVHDQVGKLVRSEKEDRSLRIEADLGSATVEAADAVVSQIFLTPADSFADLVPDYWKPCVSAAVAGTADKQYSGCVFSPEFATTPGFSSAAAERPQPEQAGEAPLRNVRVGKGGVTPPRVILQKEPEFTDEARRAKYQGTDLLMLVVDKTGHVQNIRVVRPLGMGLDRKAVETVSNWQFNPGTRNGDPVAVELGVEVNFHLY